MLSLVTSKGKAVISKQFTVYSLQFAVCSKRLAEVFEVNNWGSRIQNQKFFIKHHASNILNTFQFHLIL